MIEGVIGEVEMEFTWGVTELNAAVYSPVREIVLDDVLISIFAVLYLDVYGLDIINNNLLEVLY